MRLPVIFASALALAACAAPDTPSTEGAAGQRSSAAHATSAASATVAGSIPRGVRTIAGLPDKGQLISYTGAPPVQRSAYTWHQVALSEAHAMGAIVSGTLEVQAPDGTPIRLRYDHHVEHPNGDWTWIGRPEGAKPGTEAIITFGEKAVFGTIPNGRKPALRVDSVQGRTYLLETDPLKIATLANVGRRPAGPDAVAPPALAGARNKALQLAAAKPQQLTASGAVPESATVDVVIGYTNGFASRLGGTSQAMTRLNNLVDITNQAFTNSQVVARVRLLHAVALNYPDATSNEDALRALSGLSCTENPDGTLDCDEVPVPAALQPLVNARESYGGDLISLVRNFSDPENESCGIAWMLGAGRTEITSYDAYAGVSVVSDSRGMGPDSFPDNGYVCRDETFAHELAHNMGSAHDAVTQGGGDGLQDEEYGRYSYSFGYKTGAGGFYTIMAYGDDGQTGIRVYSNPRISAPCGQACGTANADNAKSLGQTAPVIAQFYFSTTFADVPRDHWAYNAIQALYEAGVTGGCGTTPMRYCPTSAVTRDSMAVFLLRAKHGSGYQPPAATGMFSDVPAGHWARAWIEQAAREGITGGCGTAPLRYCPSSQVLREQMAVMLLRARHGGAYQPPAATGMYVDVPTSYWAASWIEQLSREGISGGCIATPKTYCPTTAVSRDQMAVFLGRAFTF